MAQMSAAATSRRDASSIIDQLQRFRKDELIQDVQVRNDALGLARKLVTALEDPMNVAAEVMFLPYITMVARIGIDLDLYGLIDQCNGSSITTSTLSEKCGCNPILLHRILRMLASVGFVAQVDEVDWAPTRITKAMTNPAIAAGHRMVWDTMMPAATKAPQFLHETSYALPTSPADGLFQFGNQTRYNSFEYLVKVQPERLKDFNLYMGNVMGSRSTWLDWYPVKERLLDDFKDDTVLLVDVGGGKGHDLQAFKTSYPDAPGPLILQDLPQALNGIKQGDLDASIQPQVQDFLTPNQVKGAKAYFMHHVLHDWSDEYAATILSHLHQVMTPGYSKLLIHDMILPDVGATQFQGMFDLTMMLFCSGTERGLGEWRTLLETAGFKIVKFWYGKDGDGDGLIEAEQI